MTVDEWNVNKISILKKNLNPQLINYSTQNARNVLCLKCLKLVSIISNLFKISLPFGEKQETGINKLL